MTHTEAYSPGDHVSYDDVNLYACRGIFLGYERGPHGGDCRVRWTYLPENVVAEECAFNLRKVSR